MEAKVIFRDEELKEIFECLEKNDNRLFKEINRALGIIQQNAFFGRNVKKELIPKILIQTSRFHLSMACGLNCSWNLECAQEPLEENYFHATSI